MPAFARRTRSPKIHVNLVYSHLPQRRFVPPCRPALQIAQVDRPHCARRQPELLGYSTRRRALARLPHCILEPLAERGLARQLRDLLGLDPTTNRRLMVASLRYLDTFVKVDGEWLFAERLLYVDWLEERTLS